MLTQMPVSVSLRSIVHSYLKEVTNEELSKCIASFRLLTEYRSFLLSVYNHVIASGRTNTVSVSLRSIVHSYTTILFRKDCHS